MYHFAMEKRKVSGRMVVKAYSVLERAVEEGFRRGWARAHKHTDAPDESYVEEQVVSAIMGDVCDVFDFPDDFPSETEDTSDVTPVDN